MTNNLRRRQARRLPDTSPGLTERGNGRGVVMGILVGMMAAGGLQADGEVSTIATSLKPATPFAYTVGGIEYQWGMGSNQIMESFTSDGRSFAYAMSADRVEIQRHDIPGVATGEPCGIFVERLSDGDNSRQYAADYPSDGSDTGNCDIAAMLSSRVLNRGAIDLFSNQLPDAKNIERLDYIFDYGVLVPIAASMMDLAGHVASEKRSNNPVKMAAILSLDILGQPASYGPLIKIGASGCSTPVLCYGITDLQHQYSFLQNDYNSPQGFPVETERSFESVGMAFVSTTKLGLQAGQRYYGFSMFADDVDAGQHDLLDPATFPTNTANNPVVLGDDADIYGGLSGYFVADEMNVTTGAVFNDVNGNGIPDDNEAGVSNIQITLYEDVNGNGILDADDAQIGDTIDTDMSGNFVLPGLPDGNYIVEMNEQDPDLPAGLVNAPGTNPHPIMIAGGDSDPVYFPFIDPNGNGNGDGGATSGSTDSGNGDGGADGNTDSGNGDGGADGNTDSGNGDGGADGNTDSGNGDGGADGSTDSGNGDGGADGNTDSGNGDGGADGNTDSGNGDGGADGNTDSGNGDGGADGNTDSGNGDGGADGNTDSGNGDGGADGNTDSGNGDGGADGNTDSGNGDGGADGNTDSGNGDGGADGNTDSGNGDGGADGNTDSGTGDGGADGNTDSGNGDGGLDDDSLTDAIDDVFEINQGRAGIFDVLANDTDGVGTGLTLTNASESPNADINVINNQVDYRPHYGFYGTDTFLYTMQDGSGAEFTGNVEVNVIHFSDLNNNGLNDFVECDCTDLTLQTGVNGSGVGSLSLFGAWVLLMGVGVRRMRGRKASLAERGVS